MTKITAPVLLIDDDVDLLTALEAEVRKSCSNVFTATDGALALEVLRKNPTIAAILSDIRMPNMSGLELLAQLRSESNFIPFVILSSHGDHENFREAIRLQATDFLTKPFDAKELMGVLLPAIEYGVEIQKIENSLKLLFASDADSPAEFAKKVQVRRALALMRLESSIYLKKKNSA